MRVRQLWNWIYVHGRARFKAMTNLAKDFRAEMDALLSLARPESLPSQISSDGTRKWLLRSGGQGIRDRVHSRTGPRHAVRFLARSVAR